MSDKSKNIILWIATVVIIVAYLFWKPVFWLTGGDLKLYEATGTLKGGFDLYYIFQALFMLLVCYYLSATFQRPVTFILFWLCAGNFVDELFFDNTAEKTTELGYSIFVFVLAYRVKVIGLWNKLKNWHINRFDDLRENRND